MSFELVVIGASWGGLEAVGRILDGLPDGFGCAVALVQHRGHERSALASLLGLHSSWPVREVDDKSPIEPGTLAVAPADYHLLVEPGHFALSKDEPVRFSRPSIDVLFESAADAYRERTIGVVLTGANEDGAAGLARIKARGGYAIVQTPASAAHAVMPQAAIDRVEPDAVLALDEIADHLVALCRAGTPTSRTEPAR
jgi:two-component system, chemotaxis family, protein-glutamate methylesterase/glutaminase